VPRRRALASFAAAGLLLCQPPPAATAQASFPSREVTVHIVLAAGGVAAVTEDYVLIAAPNGTAFQFLNDSCAAVGPISASVNGQAIQVRPLDVRGPWTFLRLDPATAPARRGDVVRVRYTVSAHGAEAAVPIVMPAAPLEAFPGGRGARVEIVVQWTGAPGAMRVAMPRLESAEPPSTWRTALLAMPSKVRIDFSPPAGGTSCDRDVTGPTGGLEWRFAVFAGAMAIWVPAYLWWFARRWPEAS
jgi:hypothetical protein